MRLISFFALLMEFERRELRLLRDDMLLLCSDAVVAEVELLRERDQRLLSRELDDCVVCIEARLLAVVLCRRTLVGFTEPPKTSLLPPLVFPWKRLREIASRPNIAAFERTLAVGVPGTDKLPVRKLKSPYVCTIMRFVISCKQCDKTPRTCLHYPLRNTTRLYNLFFKLTVVVGVIGTVRRDTIS